MHVHVISANFSISIIYFFWPNISDLLEIKSGHNEVLLEIVNVKSTVWRIEHRKTGNAAEVLKTNVNDSYKITQRTGNDVFLCA